jgi:PAS domain S-box-containing protein
MAVNSSRRREKRVAPDALDAPAKDSAGEIINVEIFAQRIAAMRERVRRLFHSAHQGVTPELLAQSFDELQFALEELQTAEEALRVHAQQRLNTRADLDAKRHQYFDLFEQAPVAYLVTSPEGTIRLANGPAAELLNVQARQLMGRSLALFVPEGSRRAFRSQLAEICHDPGPHEWLTRIRQWEGEQLDVLLLVSTVFDSQERPAAMRWLIHRPTSPALFHEVLQERELGA